MRVLFVPAWNCFRAECAGTFGGVGFGTTPTLAMAAAVVRTICRRPFGLGLPPPKSKPKRT